MASFLPEAEYDCQPVYNSAVNNGKEDPDADAIRKMQMKSKKDLSRGSIEKGFYRPFMISSTFRSIMDLMESREA